MSDPLNLVERYSRGGREPVRVGFGILEAGTVEPAQQDWCGGLGHHDLISSSREARESVREFAVHAAWARMPLVVVYFLRHGSAEPPGPGQPDQTRTLTERGREELEHVLTLARGSGVKPAVVIVSPYLRARQTASIAENMLACGAPAIASDALVPGSEPQRLWDEVRVHRAESILVVSHEPLLSSTIAWMLGSSRDVVGVPPGGLIAVEIISDGPAPTGMLRWMLTGEVGRL